MATNGRTSHPVFVSGILLGCGLGAMFDGIVLRQLLQWHNMLSSVNPAIDLASMKYNMLWDGLFHAAAWVVTAAGVANLWQAGRRPEVRWSNARFGGALLSGWGYFNVVEGVVAHHLLGLHHVHPGEHELAWDLGFLACGLAMLVSGVMLARRSRAGRIGSAVFYGF